MLGIKVKIASKTRKGKNVIHNHGRLWKVIGESNYVSCVDGFGLLIRSLQSDELRWIALEDDIDFTFKKVRWYTSKKE